MLSLCSRTSGRVSGPARAGMAASLAFFATSGLSSGQQSTPGQQSASGGQAAVQKSSEPAPQRRIPRQQALTTAAVDGVLRETVLPGEFRPVAAAQLALRHFENGQIVRTTSSAEGVFRVLLLPQGHYEFRVEAEGYAPFIIPDLVLSANEVTTLEISLVSTSSAEFRARLPRLPELGPAIAPARGPSLGKDRKST